MRVGVIGTGYVGLVTGTCFAELGHQVICLDIDQSKLEKLREGICPIYEPGLTDLLSRNIQQGRLSFTSDYSKLSMTKIVFLAVGTPPKDDEDGSSDLTAFFSAIESSIPHLEENSVLVIKSTVPVGTHKLVQEKLNKLTKKQIFVVNNPEFLKEGHAVEDFLHPDRIVVGVDNGVSEKLMDELYAPLAREGHSILKMSNASAEMTKYASNSLLATKISFINEMSRLCELTKADIEEVRRGMISDKRIGPYFLSPGPGFGGSCFPKDIKALIHTGKQFDLPMTIATAVNQVNEKQKRRIFDKLIKALGEDIQGAVIALWGVAFKPDTDDIRESPSLYLVEWLLKETRAKIQIYDPVANQNFKNFCLQQKLDMQRLTFCSNQYDSLKDSSAVIIVTDWAEFKGVDLRLLKTNMKRPLIFDTRNILEARSVLNENIEYMAVGKYIREIH